MESEFSLQVILLRPPSGVDFALQKGRGNNYETVQKQRSGSKDLTFRFTIRAKGDRVKDHAPHFSGDFVQGPAGNKFIYIDIGTYAGQNDTPWARRLKIPLTGISWNDIEKLSDRSLYLETRVPGTGRDGGPNCATVKPFDGWKIREL